MIMRDDTQRINRSGRAVPEWSTAVSIAAGAYKGNADTPRCGAPLSVRDCSGAYLLSTLSTLHAARDSKVGWQC